MIEHLDNVLMNGTDEEVNQLKSMFGMEGLVHSDDVMGALAWAPFLWQGKS